MNTKTKQRCVGLLILLAILAIFLPLLFHNAHPSVETSVSVDIPAKPSVIQAVAPQPLMLSQANAIALPQTNPVNEVLVKKPIIQANRPIKTIAAKSPNPLSHNAHPLPAPSLSLKPAVQSMLGGLSSQPMAWVVQLGTFRHESNAQRLIAKLRGKGFDAYFRPLIDAKGHRFLRVFVGPEIRKASAKQLCEKLSAAFHLRGVVRQYQVKLST